MTKKPKGRKYRNLSARQGAIYYERMLQGSRVCFSTKTTDWDEAAAIRDLWEERKGIANGLPYQQPQTFGELADGYLQSGLADASAPCAADQRRLLRRSSSPTT